MSTPTDGNTHEVTAPLHAALNGDHTSAVGALLEEAIGRPGPHHPVTCPELADMRTHIVLTTNDGATFLPKREFITEHSGLLRDLLADADEEVIKEAVSLPNVTAHEPKRILWLLGQGFTAAQLERCIATFDIEGVVALQQVANFMDVRRITMACGGVIGWCVQRAADDEERTQLLELVTPPRLPQELCELWLGRYTDDVDELLQLLVKHPDQLLIPLAHWDSGWADKGRFSKCHFELSDETEFSLLKERSEVIEQSQGASPLKIRLHGATNDNHLRRVRDLSVLVSLDLSRCNKITDAGLAHIKELKQLTTLSLEDCNKITDTGLAHVKELPQLTSLNLGSCWLITDTGLAHVKELAQLTSVNLAGCDKITDTGLAHFEELPQLKELILYVCDKITDAGLAHLQELKQLKELNLGNCNKITGTGLAHLKELPQLTSLNLGGPNKITDTGLVHLKELPQLTSLNLGGPNKITDTGLAHLKELPQLTELSLFCCGQITDDGLTHMKELKQLKKLNLDGCSKITDVGLTHIKELKQLTSVNLEDCNQITDVGLTHIKELKQLTELNLKECIQITDVGLAHLKEMSQLTSLDLWDCGQITDIGLVHVKNLPQLTELNVSMGKITRGGWLLCCILSADVDAHAFTYADVTWRLPDGTTLLHVAAQKNRKKAVAVLLRKGADVNAVDDRGRTPLRVAMEANATDAIRLLA